MAQLLAFEFSPKPPILDDDVHKTYLLNMSYCSPSIEVDCAEKATWIGCGDHKAQVMARIPAE
jgi:hypothetical protein